MSFAEPMWLLLLLAIPIALVLHARRGRRVVVRYPALARVERSGKTWRQRVRWLPMALRCLALGLVVVGLARPREGVGEMRVMVDGVAMMGVLDRSGSMGEPMSIDGGQMNKLEVLKRSFREFVGGTAALEELPGARRTGPELAGRPHDLIGAVQFSGVAETISPLSSVHETLINRTDEIALAPTSGFEAGTAIGDALALAAARLKDAERELEAREDALRNAREGADSEPREAQDFTIRSKVILLFTDGVENSQQIDAAEAAEICREWGIKVYTVGIGGDPVRGARGWMTPAFDERMLKSIAEMTGGIYRRANDAASLREIYQEIDALEKTDVRAIEYTSYREMFGFWVTLAAGLLVLEIALGALVFGRAT